MANPSLRCAVNTGDYVFGLLRVDINRERDSVVQRGITPARLKAF